MRVLLSTMQCVVAVALVALAALSPTTVDAHMNFYQPCPRGAPWSGGACQLPNSMWTATGEYGTTGKKVVYETAAGGDHTCGTLGQRSFTREAVPHYTWKEGQAIDLTFGLQVDHNQDVKIGYFSYDAAKGTTDTNPDWFSPIQAIVNARNYDSSVRGTPPAFVEIGDLPTGQIILPLGSASPYGGLWATHLSWHACIDAVVTPAAYVITDSDTNAALDRVVAVKTSTVSLVIDVVKNDPERATDITSVTWSTTPAATTAAAAATAYPYTYTIDPAALTTQPTSQITVTAVVAYTNGRTATFSTDVKYNELCGSDYTCADIYSHPVPNRQCNGAQCTTNKTTFCCRPNETCGTDFTQAECVAVDALTTLNTATKCTTPQCTAAQCCDDNDTCSQTCPAATHYPINRASPGVVAPRCPSKACVLGDCCAVKMPCDSHTCTAPVFVKATDADKLAQLCDGPCTDEVCCDLAGQCVEPVVGVPTTCTPNSYPLKDIVYATHYCDGATCRNNECCYTTQCDKSFAMDSCFFGYTPHAAAVLAVTDCTQDPCLPATCCKEGKTCAADFVCAAAIEFDRDGKRHTFHPKPNYETITCFGDECTQADCCLPNDTCSTFATCGVGTHNPAMLLSSVPSTTGEPVADGSDAAATTRRLLQAECVAAENPAPAACPDGSTDVGTLDLTTCEWSGCSVGRDGCVGATCAPSECCLQNQSCASHACPAGMVPKDFASAAERAAPCTDATCVDTECCVAAPTCAVQGPTADVCGVAGAAGARELLPSPEAILCDSATCRFGECCASDVTCGADYACAALGAAADLVTAAAAASGQVLTVGAWTSRPATTTCRGTACVLDECCASPPLRGTCAAFACPLSMIPLDLASLKVCTGVDCTPTECCTARVMCPSTPEAQLALCKTRAPLANSASIPCSSETCSDNECCAGAVVIIDGEPTPVTCASFVASETAVCNGALPVAVRDPATHNCPDQLCEVADCCVAAPALPTCGVMTPALCNASVSAVRMQVVDAAATVTCGTVDCTVAECCAPLTCRDFAECAADQQLKAAFATHPCVGASCTAAVCCEAKPDDGGDACPTTINDNNEIVDCNGDIIGTVTVNSDGETVNSDGEVVDSTGKPVDGGDECKTTINDDNEIIDCNGVVVGTIIVNSKGQNVNSDGQVVDEFGVVIDVSQPEETEDGSIGMIIGIVVAVLLCVALALLFLWRRQNPKAPGAGANMRQKPTAEMDDNDLTGESIDTNDGSASISVDQGEDLMF